MISDEQMNELKQFIFAQSKKEYKKCLWPNSDCKQDSIKAHSIQNGQALDRLVFDHHVVMAVPRLNLNTGQRLEIEFELVGRKKATTFTGLCKQHDNELFRPIDDYEFNINNEEQKFLIAYRSILREYHVRKKAAIDVNKAYQKFVEVGKFNPDNIDEPMLKSSMGIVNLYTFYIYKQTYDNIYKAKTYSEIEHDYIEIMNKSCPLAVSSLISSIDNMKFIIFNVFPRENGAIILFSYIKSHKKNISPYINEIKNTSGEYQLYLLSKMILRYCENFVINPDHFNSFSSQKIDIIKAFYYETSISVDYDYNHEALMLF